MSEETLHEIRKCRENNMERLQKLHSQAVVVDGNIIGSMIDKYKTDLELVTDMLKSGLSELDVSALITACVKYTMTQFVVDNPKIKYYEEIRIRTVKPRDIIIKGRLESWNNSLEFQDKGLTAIPSLRDFKYQIDADWHNVVILGVADATPDEMIEDDEYPLEYVRFDRNNVRIIDMVDLEDMYYAKCKIFSTPIMIKDNDIVYMTLKFNNSVYTQNHTADMNLKLLGIVTERNPDFKQTKTDKVPLPT